MLRKVLSRAALLALVVALPGCKSKAESITEEMLGCVEDLTAELEKIKDKDSAEKAAPKLKELGRKVQEITERRKKIEVTEDEKKKLEEKYGQRVKKADGKMIVELKRVGVLGIGSKEVQEALKGLKP